MTRRVLIVGAIALAAFLGARFSGSESAVPAVSLGPPPALAGTPMAVAPGETFVSTDGGNAYLWRRTDDRIELVGQCVRVDPEATVQAPFVWLPGVERRK